MTSISIIKQTNRVHMITDGLSNGRLVNKPYTFPHLNLVMASTGMFGAGSRIAAEANQATSYDDLKDNIGELMRHCEREFPRDMRSRSEPDYEIHIAGISETRGPEFYCAVSHRRRHGVLPYEAFCHGGDVMLQPGTPAIWQKISVAWQGTPVESLDPMSTGPFIIETQRDELNAQRPDAIGGLCLVTTVSTTNITQGVAKRWPLHLGWEHAA